MLSQSPKRMFGRADLSETLAVAVVDPRPGDYAAALAANSRIDVCWRFLQTAGRALRVARTRRIDLWAVNAVLPDMSGLDLCQMLRDRDENAAVILVAESCNADQERIARRCGAVFYECKPLSAEWFESRLCFSDFPSVSSTFLRR